jgi:hypothetical protein
VVAGIVAQLLDLPPPAVVLAEDETPLNLAFTHRSLAAGLRVLLLAT